jgi:hypothetical protein
MALLPLMFLPRGGNSDRVLLDEHKLVDLVAKLGWKGGEFGHGRELKSTRYAQMSLSSQRERRRGDRRSMLTRNVLEEQEH